MSESVQQPVVEVEQEEMFRFVWGDNYLALPRDPQPWLIEKLVPAGGLMNLYSKPKMGKSYLALGIAEAVSNPLITEYLGRSVIKHGPVAYLQIDTPRNEWGHRVEILKESVGFCTRLIAFTDANLVPYPLDITADFVRAGLQKWIEKNKPALLIVDTLREIHEGDENKSEIMKKVITALVQCSQSTNTTVLLVSHSRKENVNIAESITDDGRGSSYVAGRMDIIAKLTEKGLWLKGRSIGENKIIMEQDADSHMWTLNANKAEQEANTKYCAEQPNLSIRDRAKLLQTFDPDLKFEAARTRIRTWLQNHGQSAAADQD